jgi:hypothetical protein
MEPSAVLEWVERLGGWGVVVWVVFILLKANERDRADHKEEVAALLKLGRDAIREEERAHTDIRASLGRLEQKLLSIRNP